MNVVEPNLFLTNQTVESQHAKQYEQAILVSDSSSEMQESVNSLLGGISGLLFALSLSFFLQAPFVSVGVLLTLVAGWFGIGVYQDSNDHPKT